MKVYFVRHGKSQDSESGFYQRADSPLSGNGKSQAEALAKRLDNIEFEKIISSTLQRAYETANIVAKKKNMTVYENSLFVEEKRPSAMEGKSKNDPKVIKIREMVRRQSHNIDFKYSDEESFTDLKRRVIKAISSLEDESKMTESLLLVSHGIIARMMVALFMFGDDLTSHQFLLVADRLSLSKVSISIFEYMPKKDWKIITWNDQTTL